MKAMDRAHTRLLRRLAWTGAALAFGLIVLGGVVRITGSGMGCGDHWPRCHGEWFPPLDLPTMIEIGHRWAAALVSAVVLAIAAVAWIRHRSEPHLRNPATLALVLLVAQVLLGAVTVKLALPPWVVITHLANAMVLLAVLLVMALRAGHASLPGPRHPAHSLILGTAGLGYVVATHQSLRTRIDRTVWTYYWALADGAPAEQRRALLAKDWGWWKEAILTDLSRPHPDIRSCVKSMDMMRMGHAMIRPSPGFLFSTERKRWLTPQRNLFFANSDLSGLSLFEEAQYRGVRAADGVLRVVSG